jgi:hypothetical protein
MADEEVAHQEIVHGRETNAQASYVNHVPEAQLLRDVSSHDPIRIRIRHMLNSYKSQNVH